MSQYRSRRCLAAEGTTELTATFGYCDQKPGGYLPTALAAVFISGPDGAAGAQTLVVPLTGQRVRDIETSSLFHTLFSDFFLEDDATTYVQTGDIPAMWLRDSAAQTIPYVRYQSAFPILRGRFAGVIERDARSINTDAYANAFRADYSVWERKWEIDSLAWPVILASVYWRHTKDATVLTPELHVALRMIVVTYGCEEHHRTCSRYSFAEPVPTSDAAGQQKLAEARRNFNDGKIAEAEKLANECKKLGIKTRMFGDSPEKLPEDIKL